VRAGIAVADVGAGPALRHRLLIALLERENSGQGQWVSSSLLQAMISMCDFQAARWTIAKDVPGQAGNNHPTGIPTGVFKDQRRATSTSRRRATTSTSASATPIKAPELLTDERFSSAKARVKHRDVLNAEIDKRMAGFTSAEAVEKLNKAGVPAGPIYKMDEMFADPQVKHLKMAHPVEHPKLGTIELIGQAINMSRHAVRDEDGDAGAGRAPPESVLAEFGYDAAAIDRLPQARRDLVLGARHSSGAIFSDINT
jgi:formyl-CoA transferase